MPIKTRFEVRNISDDEFYSLDYKIMGIVFDVHNEFGRFCDEKIYKTEIADRCQKGGIGTVQNDSRIIGYQKVHLLNPQTAFKISAVKKHIPLYEQHLRMFLQHTSLRAIHLPNTRQVKWVNFNNHSISFKTIKKNNFHYSAINHSAINHL